MVLAVSTKSVGKDLSHQHELGTMALEVPRIFRLQPDLLICIGCYEDTPPGHLFFVEFVIGQY